MKEIMAFIRVNKVEETRRALEMNGFFAYSCRKCLGRGKNSLSDAGKSLFLASGGVSERPEGGFYQNRRLIAKRLFLVAVADEDISRAVKIIIEANQTGNPGDGKIFVRNIEESYTIRSGKLDTNNQ